MREKGKRHNNRRGKLKKSRETTKTLTINHNGADLVASRDVRAVVLVHLMVL